MTNDIKITLVEHHHYYTIVQVYELYIGLYILIYLQDLRMAMYILELVQTVFGGTELLDSKYM